MTSVYVAAGSNVEPVRNLRIALDVLHGHFAPLRVSNAYENAAVGFSGDDFINLVLGFETDMPLQAVMDRLQDAEAACGRERHAPKWAPRSMDLDILLFGDEVRDEPGLKLPRPDLVRRPYMMGPAAEIAPDVMHPTLHETLANLWDAMQATQTHEMRVVDLGWQPETDAAPIVVPTRNIDEADTHATRDIEATPDRDATRDTDASSDIGATRKR